MKHPGIGSSAAVDALLRLGTLQAAGDSLGVSRQRIQQLIKKSGVAWGRQRVTPLWCAWPQPDTYEAKATERFWSYTARTPLGCVVWTGATMPFGYGQTTWRGKSITSHRMSWTLANGPIPAGMCVLHTCDNPPCVNPDHLWIGTQGDNNRDRHQKGRDGSPAKGSRGACRWPRMARAATCPNGHLRERHPDGRMDCRTCKALYDARRYSSRKLTDVAA